MSCVTKTIGLAEFALQSQQLLLQFGAHDRVDGAERFVHEQDVRIDREAPRDAHALLLATRELAGIPIGERSVESDRVEQLEGVVVRVALPGAAQQRHRGDVVDDPAVRQQARVLHDVADAATKRHGLTGRDIGAVDQHLPRCRVDHAIDHAEQRGLARTR